MVLVRQHSPVCRVRREAWRGWAVAEEIRCLSHTQGRDEKAWIRSREQINSLQQTVIRWPDVILRTGQAEAARGNDLHRPLLAGPEVSPGGTLCPYAGSTQSFLTAFDKITLTGYYGWSRSQELTLYTRKDEGERRKWGSKAGSQLLWSEKSCGSGFAKDLRPR